MINNPYEKYKQQSVNTATPEELTLMLYDGCIKFIKLARFAINDKEIEKANDNLLKAQAIVTELDITLDDKYELSKNLHSLYDFVLDRLVNANIKKDASLLDAAESVITDLRDGWKEAIPQMRKVK